IPLLSGYLDIHNITWNCTRYKQNQIICFTDPFSFFSYVNNLYMVYFNSFPFISSHCWCKITTYYGKTLEFTKFLDQSPFYEKRQEVVLKRNKILTPISYTNRRKRKSENNTLTRLHQKYQILKWNRNPFALLKGL